MYYKKTEHKMMTQKNILYTIFYLISLSISYNKTRKSRLKYEIEYDL